MIILTTSRQDAETILQHFFPAFNMYKTTRVNNVKNRDRFSEEYLAAVVINCIIAEIELLFQKKLINTISKKINFRFTDAQAAVLYKSLMALPIDPEKIYFNILRNQWIKMFDLALLKGGVYKRVQPAEPIASHW
jgi:hypothetical protein